VSSNDLWIVGDQDVISTESGTLIEHGDGYNWDLIPSPNVITANTHGLAKVAAISSTDVWAVGYYAGRDITDQALTEHWDGTQWSMVPSSNVASDTKKLLSVAALSAHDVWAVGYHIVATGTIGYQRTLTEHWDGTRWTIVPSP